MEDWQVDFYRKRPELLRQKYLTDAAHEVHEIVCDRCGDQWWPWYLLWPLVGWRQWRGYQKLNRVRNYVYEWSREESDRFLSMLEEYRHAR